MLVTTDVSSSPLPVERSLTNIALRKLTLLILATMICTCLIEADYFSFFSTDKGRDWAAPSQRPTHGLFCP